MPAVRLRIVEDDDEVVVPLGSQSVTLGRSTEAAVQLAEPLASRVHCEVMPNGESGWKLVDLESANGTMVNGTRVNQRVLEPGDRIAIGDAEIHFELDPTAEAEDWRLRGARGRLRRLRAGRKRRRARSASVASPAPEAEPADATEADALEGALVDALDAIRRGYGADGLLMAERLFQEYVHREGRRELEALRLRAEQTERLLEVAKALNSERTLKRLLASIMDAVIQLTKAERGFLILIEDNQMKIEVARNFDREAVRNPSYKISSSIAQQVAREGQPIIANNAQDDPRFREYMSVSDLKLRSLLCAPFKIRDQVVGVVYIDNRFEQGVFTEAERQLLAGFCDQAAIAIENARLHEQAVARRKELEEQAAQIAELNRRLSQKVEHQQVEIAAVREDLRESRAQLQTKYNYDNIIGRAPSMQQVFRLLDRITDSDVPVVIQGESGTGKELVARAIHFNGPRKGARFVSENCAAIPEALLESELFGHVRGAFTGAVKDKPGLFEVASGGTLFLDEIGDMPLDMQKKLLRALQEGEIRRVGSKNATKVDVRIISASNQDLRAGMKAGTFREDLFYRLNGVTVGLPPLRERREDIPLLVEHFLEVIAVEMRTPRRRANPAAMALLMAYRWPGNVRELENEVRRAVALSIDLIGADELSPEVRGQGAADPGASYIGRPLKEVVREATEQVERLAIKAALEIQGWNKVQTAAALDISRPTLDAKIEIYGLQRPEKET